MTAREFFHRHRTVIVTGGIAILIVAGGLKAIDKFQATEHEAGEAAHKVRVIQRNGSNCLPKQGQTKPRRPKLCKAGFDTAVALITPFQACEIVAKGARLLVVDGRHVHEVRCEPPRSAQHESSSPPTASEPSETPSAAGGGRQTGTSPVPGPTGPVSGEEGSVDGGHGHHPASPPHHGHHHEGHHSAPGSTSPSPSPAPSPSPSTAPAPAAEAESEASPLPPRLKVCVKMPWLSKCIEAGL